MIDHYDDFEINIYEDAADILIDINGRPVAINIPEPIRIPKSLLSNIKPPPVSGNDQLAEWGYELYHSIFRPQIEGLFEAYVNRRKSSEGIRVCIDPRVNRLNAIPWELVCSRLAPAWNFVALDPRTPVIRIPRIGREVYIREISTPIKILVVLASPKRIESIDAAKEKKSIQDALTFTSLSPILVDFLGFDDPTQASFDRIQSHLASRSDAYDILHIIGHGIQDEKSEGALALVDPADGKQQIVPASSLANLVRSQRIMMVILQACQSAKVDPASRTFSSLAQQLVAAGIPAALAMQEDIDQDLATHFLGRMYSFWINKCCQLEEAITQARISVYQSLASTQPTGHRLRSWAIPVLYICPGLQLKIQQPVISPVLQASLTKTGVRQMDAALPAQCQLGKETELYVMVRPRNKPGLREMILARPSDFEPTPEDVRSTPSLLIDFPVNQSTQKVVPVYLKLVAESEQFMIPDAQRTIKIHPQGDQVLCVFLVTPIGLGVARLNVRLIDPRHNGDIYNLVIKSSIMPSVLASPLTLVISSETCPVCSLPIQTGEEFCKNCGYSLGDGVLPFPPTLLSPESLPSPQNQVACYMCGHVNRTNASYCIKCGSRLRPSASNTGHVGYPPASEPLPPSAPYFPPPAMAYPAALSQPEPVHPPPPAMAYPAAPSRPEPEHPPPPTMMLPSARPVGVPKNPGNKSKRWLLILVIILIFIIVSLSAWFLYTLLT